MALRHRRRRRLQSIWLVAVASRPSLCQLSKFDLCKNRLDRILNGTEVYNGIDNITIHQYFYHGTVGGMRPEYARQFRDTFVTITTEGCKAICEEGDPVDWYWTSDPSLTLGIVSNWILPIIALLAALPFDGGSSSSSRGRRRRRARDTARAVWNWLGSPQTALTATFFNIHQMRVCLGAARSSSIFENRGVAIDAYYVLSCVGQFELPATDAGLECFLNGLVYGLFKPSTAHETKAAPHTLQAERWTGDLLRAMAHQMRRSRRLGIYSTLASILLFFVAYAASVVLAFAEGLGERTTTHSLAFGILITWLPLLLLFSILDRNPNSADRTREFIRRWLWNVRAVQEWERERERERELQGSRYRGGAASPPPYWWTEERERQVARAAAEEEEQADPEPAGYSCCAPASRGRLHGHELGAFIGQGRKMGYFGLALSLVKAAQRSKNGSEDQETFSLTGAQGAATTGGFDTLVVNRTREHLAARPPLAWLLLALTALAMVWWELGMALTISYNIPTVGIGCRSGSYLVYGGLSTVPWLAHVYRCLVLGPRKTPRKRGWLARTRQMGHVVGLILDGLSAVCMLLAVPCLGFIIFAAVSFSFLFLFLFLFLAVHSLVVLSSADQDQFSGVLKNCTCRGGVNGYIDFEGAAFYRNPAHFDVEVWWVVAAVTAAVPVVMSFVVALPLLVFKLQPLWQEHEKDESGDIERSDQGTPLLHGEGADMEWVAR